ncbi:MAG: hypothetical protein HQ500_13050 [Flavobacteriales bacterium]|nr:hypothetical protein [Flavobacteriales bacterium]
MKWRRNFYLLFAATFLVPGMQAQDSLIQWSPSISVPKSEDILDFTLVDDTVPVLISQFGEALIMRNFTDGEDDKPLFIRSAGDASLVAKDINGDVVTMLERTGQSSDGTFRLSRSRLSSGSVTRFYTHDFHLNRKAQNGLQNPLILAVSEHGEMVAVCQQQIFQRASKGEFNILISGAEQSRLFHLPSDYASDDIELLGATIDTAGIVYLGVVAGVKLNSPFRKRYLIYSFNPLDSVLTEFDLSSQDLFIRDVVIHASDEGLYVAALYNSDPLEERKSSGFVFIKLTADAKEIEQRIISTFDASFVEEYEGAEAGNSASVDNIYIQDILHLGQNPVLAVEKHYQDQLCTADPRTGMMNCTDQFHFQAIALIDIHGQRTLMTIDRHQIDYDKKSPYSSHASTALGEGEQLFLYNDHFKNEGIRSEKVMNNPNRSVPRFVRIRPSGEFVSATLTNDRQTEYVFTPQFGILWHEQTVFILSMNNRNLRAGAVSTTEL